MRRVCVDRIGSGGTTYDRELVRAAYVIGKYRAVEFADFYAQVFPGIGRVTSVEKPLFPSSFCLPLCLEGAS